YLDEQYSNTFYGIVSNGEESIEGAIVSAHLLTDSGDLEISTISGNDGAYQLTVPDGNFNLSVSMTGYQISWVNDVSIENGDLEVNFTLNSIESFDGALMGSVYFFGNLSGSATINIFNDNYFAETVTAENGTFYVNLINGTYTIFASSNGYASITIPDAFTIQDDVVTYDIHFSQPGFVEPPVISSLVDVPNDQGRKLDMAWLPGDAEDLGTFTQYSIWRKILNLPPGSPELWHYITTENFIDGVELYEKVVPTLIDANQDTVYYSTFMVTAHTDDPYVFFDSPPYSGFSVDNLSPEAPRDLSVLSTIIDNEMYQVDLSWSTSTAEDFAYHNVYRSDLNSEEAAMVFQTIESAYVDIVSEWGNFEYWVTAVDHNGNESDASEISGVELSIEQEIIPEEYALHQNYPNPFNPSTQIGYALPENSNVTIVIYNMLGSKVRTLINEVQDAGFRNVLWNATNDNGAPVSAGMYIYTIQAGKFYQAKKMILLK
ncbi:MAG: carboxypeptidase regulatory-like domain-containing protein, partial [bacterium]